MLTDFLKLFKADPADGDKTFNITTMLNDNWDKLNAWAKGVAADVASLLPLKTTAIQKTTAPITYYVRPDGNDANDGSANDAAHAFRTIQKAIDMLPKHLAHNVVINCAPGIYSENIIFNGFSGAGNIMVQGGSSLTDAANYKIKHIHCTACSLIMVHGLEATTTTTHAFLSQLNNNLYLRNCKAAGAAPASYGALAAHGSVLQLVDCEISNKSISEYATASKIVSYNVSGTGNNIGLYAAEGGIIFKNATQPQANTYKEYTVAGGIITADDKGVTKWGGWQTFSSITELGLNPATCTPAQIAYALPKYSRLVCPAPNADFSQGTTPYNYFHLYAEKQAENVTRFTLETSYQINTGVFQMYKAFYYDVDLQRWSGWHPVSFNKEYAITITSGFSPGWSSGTIIIRVVNRRIAEVCVNLVASAPIVAGTTHIYTLPFKPLSLMHEYLVILNAGGFPTNGGAYIYIDTNGNLAISAPSGIDSTARYVYNHQFMYYIAD